MSNFHCKLVGMKGLVVSGLAHIDLMSFDLTLTLSTRFNDIDKPDKPENDIGAFFLKG